MVTLRSQQAVWGQRSLFSHLQSSLIDRYLFVQFEWETKRRLNIKCGKLRIPFGPLGAASDKTNRPIVEVEVVIGCNNGFLQSRDSCAWVV